MYSSTMAKQSFASTASLTASSGQYSQWELQNPASSGVNLVVWQLQLWTSTATSVGFAYETTYTLSVSGHFPNLFAGGPSSNASYNIVSATSRPGASYNLQTPAGSTFVLGPGINPIAVIPPGGGLMLSNNAAGGFMWVLCFFSESPI